VSAKLTDTTGFEAELLSGLEGNPDFGQVFFSDLLEQEYSFQATASGYLDHNDTVLIYGDTSEVVILNPE
jgi:hypothetical protein